jgi:hypothetical protein
VVLRRLRSRRVADAYGAPVLRDQGPIGSAMGKVRAAEATTDGALAAALGQQQMLLPSALGPDHPALWIGEADPGQLLELDVGLPLLANQLC